MLLSTATAKWETLNAREEVTTLADDLNEVAGYRYKFGKDFVLKASLYLTHDLPIQYKVKNFTKANLRKIETNWDNVKTYLTTTVRLVAKFGFRWENIVAPVALIPIAFWLMKKGDNNFDKSSEKNDVAMQYEIRKWLILVLLKNSFGTSSDNVLKNLRDVLLEMHELTRFPSKELNTVLGIQPSLSEMEIGNLVTRKYRGRYTFLVLSLLYPDRNWSDTVFHEDHIFPASEFTLRGLRRRGYHEEIIANYLSVYDTILNLELLTDAENLSKNATPFEEWIVTRDDGFKERHLIPKMTSYSFDAFETFVEARKKLIIERLQDV